MVPQFDRDTLERAEFLNWISDPTTKRIARWSGERNCHRDQTLTGEKPKNKKGTEKKNERKADKKVRDRNES